MFFPIRSTTGAVMPYAELPAEAGTYEAGMLLSFNGEKLKVADNPSAMPPYLCVTNATIADGGLLTVAPTSREVTYRCDSIDGDAPTVGSTVGIVAGTKLSTAATGKIFQVTAVLEDGCVEVH